MGGGRLVEIRLRSRTVNAVALLDVAGELDIQTSPRLEEAIRQLLVRGRPRLLINLLETTYLDSTALRIFTSAARQARDAGGKVGLIYNGPLLQKVFAVTRLEEFIPAFRSEGEALTVARAW